MNPEQIKDFVIAAHGDFEKVKTMLGENPAMLNEVHDWGDAGLEDALGAAAHVGNRQIAEFLLGQGAPLTICTAAMLGREADVQKFLEGDDTLSNARGAHGIPVMIHAAMSGNVSLAELLKGYGCKEGYASGLHGAVAYGHLEMVKWLLENGAADNINQPNWQGKTPLQAAQENGYTEIADVLRQHGGLEAPTN